MPPNAPFFRFSIDNFALKEIEEDENLKTEIDSKSILYWSKIILKMAKDGLKKRNFINKKGNDETVYLKNVEHILINGRTKAEDALKNYK